MNKLYIKDFDNLAYEMFKKISQGNDDITFIGNYNDSIILIKALLKLDDVIPHNILLEPENWAGYDKEFLVTLDGELRVWCEKAYRERGYFHFKSDCIYIADDCDEYVINHVESDEIFEVSYKSQDAELCDECYGKCTCFGGCTDEFESDTKQNVQLNENASEYHNISRTKDGKVTGFTKSWTSDKNGITEYSSFSYMGNNEIAVRKLAKDFGINID